MKVICPKCGSQNVNITLEQTSAKTSTRGNGCLWGIGRLLLIVCTLGLWLIVGKHRSTSHTKISSKKVALCQNCGHKWSV